MNSSDVFELRREAKELTGSARQNKLLHALSVANQLCSDPLCDNKSKKALAWTLVDLIKLSLVDNHEKAESYYQILQSIQFEEIDEILIGQINSFKPKFNRGYELMIAAEELSKSGKHSEALDKVGLLKNQGFFTNMHHEQYGWIIYRYIKDGTNGLNSVQIRKLLFQYIQLENEKPSLLHSLILGFAVTYARTHDDFNLYNFFKLWNPRNLRHEDKQDSYKDESTYSSLVSRVLRTFVEQEYDYEVGFLIETIEMPEVYSTYGYKFSYLDIPR